MSTKTLRHHIIRLHRNNWRRDNIAKQLRVSPEAVEQVLGFRAPTAPLTAPQSPHAEARKEFVARWTPIDPTPEEIAERVAEIQAGWSDAERRLRFYNARVLHSVREAEEAGWTVPELRVVDFCIG